jgi:redox-sensitive bicupin YhaK (pirin superfamily)
MLTIRRAADRGSFDHGWLQTSHTFSFGDYRDPEHMGFRALRVINDDVVAPGQGFGMHPHRDMEIVTVVLAGALEHRDSLGTGAVIHPGEVQVMTAGTGILHSEFNPSATEPVHLYQIWLFPKRKGLPPRYDQKAFDAAARRAGWQRLASGAGRDDALTIHQDAEPLRAVNGVALAAGDGLAVSDETALSVSAGTDADILLFDLA